jgi:hypothetical protein
MIDYYELLQISPKADDETIHRVYKFMASRLHPDNPRSGDAAKFRLVKTAFDVLSHPTRRSEYDETRRRTSVPPEPLSTTIDFMDQLEGEHNRRMAILALLYYRRRTNPTFPDISLADIEERMGFPRDYLDFTLWYLVRKKYVDRTDSAGYSLSVDGVDFVEKERAVVPILNGLLTTDSTVTGNEDVPGVEWASSDIQLPAKKPMSGPTVVRSHPDRRNGEEDRRTGEPDLRMVKVERRRGARDRRGTRAGRPN